MQSHSHELCTYLLFQSMENNDKNKKRELGYNSLFYILFSDTQIFDNSSVTIDVRSH